MSRILILVMLIIVSPGVLQLGAISALEEYWLVQLTKEQYDSMQEIRNDARERIPGDSAAYRTAVPGAIWFEWLKQKLPPKGSERLSWLESEGLELVAIVQFSTPPNSKAARRSAGMERMEKVGRVFATFNAEAATDPLRKFQSNLKMLGLDDNVSNKDIADLRPMPPYKLGVVVKDSGIQCGHEDLSPPRVDAMHSREFVAGYACADPGGHGTSVAGILGAITNNGKGISGITGASLISFSVFESIRTNGLLQPVQMFSNNAVILRSIVDLVDLPYDLLVVNMSFIYPDAFASDGESLWVKAMRALRHKALFIAAAGNSPVDASKSGIEPCNSSFLENVICVGAIEENGRLASFSSFGPTVNILAPAQGLTLVSTPEANQYRMLGGTSIAAPHVSGVSALLGEFAYDWGEFHRLTPAILKRAILEGSSFSPKTLGMLEASRMLNVPRALERLREILDGIELLQLPKPERLMLTGDDGQLITDTIMRGTWIDIWDKDNTMSVQGACEASMEEPADVLCGIQIFVNGYPLLLSYVSENQVKAFLTADSFRVSPAGNRLWFVRTDDKNRPIAGSEALVLFSFRVE